MLTGKRLHMLRLELNILPLGVKNPEPLDHDVSFNGYLSALQIGPRVRSSLLYINNDNHSLQPLEASKGHCHDKTRTDAHVRHGCQSRYIL
jgi:hypothetical protein